jgi:hypothetical protein
MRDMLIVGGSDASISAALCIKEISAEARVTVMTADAYSNLSRRSSRLTTGKAGDLKMLTVQRSKLKDYLTP